MSQLCILILNPNPVESDRLARLLLRVGPVSVAQSPETAMAQLEARDFRAAVIDASLAGYPSLKGFLSKSTSILITGQDEAWLKTIVRDWPAEYDVFYYLLSLPDPDEALLVRTVEQAAEHSRLRSEAEALRKALGLQEAKVREVYSEIADIKSLINASFIRELEKRIAIEAKYVWYQKERQKIEWILRKIYAANDVSSLLGTVTDIKEIVQASGISIYIVDENDVLGRYLKPLVWDDAFLSHADFTKYIARLDASDFAAAAARYGQEINLTDLTFDRRLSKRYLELLRHPLRSLLCVPVMYEREAIGVLEVYNKTEPREAGQEGFSREDQQILRGISEHIAMAMTKLNLIQYDALTGLLRPDPFFAKVLQKINTWSKRRLEEGSCALVMGDVDWFKNYNDRNGHEAGNKLLRELANVLKLSIREDDLLCRYGGEEFLFFLTGVKSLEEACLLTERIRKNVEVHYFEQQEFQPRNNLTMSFGVTYFPRRDDPAASIEKSFLKQLAGEADLAMAEAKGKRHVHGAGEKDEIILSKNKVCCYSRGWTEGFGSPVKTFNEKSFREKRRFERFYTTTILMYREDGAYYVAKTVNLSLGGARILSESRLPLAKTVDLILVFGDRASPLKSDIVYSEKAEGDSPYYCTGMRFRDVAPADKERLEGYFDVIRKKNIPPA